MITTPQIKRLYALAKLMGGLELDAWLRERYQIYSKRDLTPEQYEDACITMDRIKRGVYEVPRRRVPEPVVFNRAGVQALCEMTLGHLPPETLTGIVYVAEDWRLNRGDGNMSSDKLRNALEELQSFAPAVLEAATTNWNRGYRSRNEHYFVGICQKEAGTAKARQGGKARSLKTEQKGEDHAQQADDGYEEMPTGSLQDGPAG